MNRLLVTLEVCLICFVVVLLFYFIKLHPKTNNINPSSGNKKVEVISKLTHNVTLTSDISGMKIEPIDDFFLRNKVEELNFWDNNTVYIYHPTLKATVSSLTVYLTDKPIPVNQEISSVMGTVNNRNEEINSISEEYNKDNQHLDLSIYFNQELLKNNDIITNQRYISYFILGTLYDIINPSSTLESKDKLIQDNKQVFLKPLFDLKDKTFIRIIK